jgi:NodT family efflux transporter outer membrane factor (OMF) lipoprotein
VIKRLPHVAFGLLGVFAALGGCTVGPDYKLPFSALFNGASENDGFVSTRENKTAISVAPVPDDWWKLYDNLRLDALIQQALAANTDLRAAAANLERSRALLREAKTLREPSVMLNGGLEYGHAAGEQYLQPFAPPPNWGYETELSVGYDLDLFGGIKRGIEAASAEDEAVAAAHDLVAVNVVAGTARAYALACGAGLELVSAERSLELQRQSLTLTQRLKAGGRATDLDVARQSQLVSQLEEVIPGLKATQRNALFQLATLTGRPPAQYDADLESCAAPPRLLSELPVADGAALLKRRPDIREAERLLAASTAEIGVATAQLYPDIQLGLSAGSVGLAKDAFTAPTNFWNLGVVLNWQANQDGARARIDAANAQAKLALAQFDGTVLRSLREAESALNSYVHDLQKEGSAIAARDQARTVADYARRLQLGGRINQLAVLDAQRTLASAELSLAQLQAGISDDQIAIFLALGGGWQQSTPADKTAQRQASE